jgi:HEAT repeat protein
LVVANSNRLEEIRNSQSPDFLISVFRNGTEEERSVAAETFAQLPESAYGPLVAFCKDSDENVRRCVAVAIGKSDYYFWMPNLAQMLDDTSAGVRDAAHSSLKEMLSGLLRSRLGAAHELAYGTLKGALLEMMKRSPEAARETAYEAFKELLDEKPLLDLLARALDKTRNSVERERLEPFVRRAMVEYQLSNARIKGRDLRELTEKGLILREPARRRRRFTSRPSGQRKSRGFAN